MPNAHRDCNSPAAAQDWRNRRILRPKPLNWPGTKQPRAASRASA